MANTNAASVLYVGTRAQNSDMTLSDFQALTATTGATTNTVGYALNSTSITLASAGTGAILAGDYVTFAGDTNKYKVATGDADVSGGGTIVLASPGLLKAIPASATAITVIGWAQVSGLGAMGEAGTTTNILSYDTWDTTVTQKAKGISDAGSPTVEVARMATDLGQMLLREFGAVGNVNNYPFKIVRPNGEIIYNRGLVTGPTRPLGRNEDFDLEVFTLGFNQAEVIG
jgi:hypothetical protein